MSYTDGTSRIWASVMLIAVAACGDDSGNASFDGGINVSYDGGDASVADVPADAATDSAMPGTWQLPEGYYEPSRMPMVLVHPRNDDAPPWAYSKNAHPGIRWEIPIVVQGGAWPFRYEIVDDGGASGLAIGGELTRSSEGGFTVHRVPDGYGVVSWEDPVSGSYTIELRVSDQEGHYINVVIDLSVGTDGWVFVDAEAGDDSGDGSRDEPFATITPLLGSDETPSPFAHHRVYLSGTVPMRGNRENGNLRIASSPAPGADLAPRVWVGLPSSSAVLEAFEGRIVLDAPDFYLANLEHRHHEDYAPSGGYIHMITAYGRTARFTMHDVTVSRFQGEPENVDLGNSSVVMFTRGAAREHVAVVGCTLTGPSGVFTSTYSLRHSVFERNRVVDARVDLADGSVWAMFYIKGDNAFVSVRANEMWEGNTWSGLSAIGLLEGRNIEIAHNVVDTPYDSGRRGGLKLFTNSPQASFQWNEDTPVWVHRNSLRRRIHWEGERLANMPDGTVRIARNVIDPAPAPESSRIVNEDNLSEEGALNESMDLEDEFRTEYLGRRGATIAVPE